jgi:Na+-driven multidrug efflux pump
VLVLIIPIQIIASICAGWLLTLHRDRQMVIIVLRAGILNVALGCLLTPLLGPIGMAWSVVSAEATAMVGAMVAVRRKSSGTAVSLLRGPDQVRGTEHAAPG